MKTRLPYFPARLGAKFPICAVVWLRWLNRCLAEEWPPGCCLSSLLKPKPLLIIKTLLPLTEIFLSWYSPFFCLICLDYTASCKKCNPCGILFFKQFVGFCKQIFCKIMPMKIAVLLHCTYFIHCDTFCVNGFAGLQHYII